MYLFFDVETAGKPRSWKAAATDTFNWPRMVDFAWMIYDENRNQVEKERFIIQPEGFEIPYEAERVHGIDTETAREQGVPLKGVLQAFAKKVDEATYLIAHNMNYAEKVLSAEFYRKSIEHRLLQSERYCTMQESTYYCKLPGTQGRYKWPSLQELNQKVFNERYLRDASALNDVQVCANCFFRLVDIEAIDIF
ncbi:MAG: 3'-5' exonuclease [Bacteroidota bacterium]